MKSTCIRVFTITIVLLLSTAFNRYVSGGINYFHKVTPIAASVNDNDLYNDLHLEKAGLSKTVYLLALKGKEKLKARGDISKNLITICDFSQSCKKKRLYVIDLANRKMLFNTLVAHGRNTGTEFPRYFSNEPSSLESSLGFFVIKKSYTGKHGLGLTLSGKEPGFNDKAEERAIVMHGADYADEDFVNKWGTLGRSWGCPAVSMKCSKQIINSIKDGSCLFIYFPDKNYLATSELLK